MQRIKFRRNSLEFPRNKNSSAGNENEQNLETKQNSQTGLTTDVFDVNHSVYKWIMLLQTIKEHAEFLDCEGDELAQLASINCDWLVSLAYKPTSTGRKPYSMVEGVSDLDDHTNDD